MYPWAAVWSVESGSQVTHGAARLCRERYDTDLCERYLTYVGYVVLSPGALDPRKCVMIRQPTVMIMKHESKDGVLEVSWKLIRLFCYPGIERWLESSGIFESLNAYESHEL